MRPGAKADSFGLYMKQIGNKLLSQLLPFKKIRLLLPVNLPKHKNNQN
jgi:hypothetical protein